MLLTQEDNLTIWLDIIMIIIGIISTGISLIIPCLYYVKQEFTSHPSVLMANISLLEAISNFNVILMAINIYSFQNFIHIQTIFNFLIFNQQQQLTRQQFCIINYLMYLTIQLLSISFSCCFSLDLFITLKKPFFVGHKRMKYYYIFSFIFVLITIPASISQSIGILLVIIIDICNKQFTHKSIYEIPLAFIIALGIFKIISIIILILSLSFHSISQKRNIYINQHRTLLITLIILWIIPFLNNVLISSKQYQNTLLFQIFNIISFFSLLISGGIINIVRFIYDPYLRKKIKDMFLKKKNQLEQQDQKKQITNDQWNLPLASAIEQFNSQKIVHNMIQIVLQACLDDLEEQSSIKSELKQRQSTFIRKSTIIYNESNNENIPTIWQNQDIEKLKKYAKKIKKLNMVCQCIQQQKQSNQQTLMLKTIHKSQNNTNNSNINIIKSLKLLKSKQIEIKVTSYADKIFHQIRKMNNINNQQLIESLDIIKNYKQILNTKQSLGSSGSFFFFTFDYSLIIKTITYKENQILIQLLPTYYKHLKNNLDCLLAKIYGLFAIEIAGVSCIYLILMENCFKQFQQYEINYQKYDLKGSTVNRYVKNNNSEVLKDLNYLNSLDCFIYLSQERKKCLIEQINKDITILKNFNIMDYSLLVGVGIITNQNKFKLLKIKQKQKQNYRNKLLNLKNNNTNNNSIIFNTIIQQQISFSIHKKQNWYLIMDEIQLTNRIYLISIIDYLQIFNINKLIQLKFKQLFQKGGDISSIDTKSYYYRFIKFVKNIIVTVHKTNSKL